MERENVTFSHFDPDYLSENSSNETSRIVEWKKSWPQASQTSNRFHPRLDRLFLSTARVYLLANSYILIGRPLAGLSASLASSDATKRARSRHNARSWERKVAARYFSRFECLPLLLPLLLLLLLLLDGQGMSATVWAFNVNPSSSSRSLNTRRRIGYIDRT